MAWKWSWIAGMLAVACSSAAWISRNQLNGDLAGYFYIGEKVAGGAVLYRDVADLNPPLMSYLMTLNAWVASALHLPVHVAWYGEVWVGFALVVLFCARFSRGVLPSGWIWPLLFLAAFQFGITDRRQFG